MNRPAWLVTGHTCPLPAPRLRWARADYLTKTLGDIQKIIAEDMHHAGTAARPGLLQPVEPRVKVAGLGLLLVAVALTASLTALALFHGLLFVVALACGIGARAYLARTVVPAAVFAGVAVLPAVFSWVTPGEPLFFVYQGVGPLALPPDLAVTRQGLTAAVMVFGRAAASLGLVTLLVKTTRWPVITKALQSLGIPAVFVAVLDLTYRYLFLFLLLLTDYLLGRRSRLVGREAPVSRLEWVGGTLAGFLRMAGEYSKEIAAAMQARGYNGESRMTIAGRPGGREAVFLAAVLVIAVSLVGGIHFGRIFGF